MTGEEYWKLNRGNTVKVINKGCQKRPSNMLSLIIYVISLIIISDEEPADKKVITMPFALHDKVWFMCHDKAFLGRITSYHINSIIATGEPSIKYEILFKNDFDYNETVKDIPSYKCFSTKEELLKSL